MNDTVPVCCHCRTPMTEVSAVGRYHGWLCEHAREVSEADSLLALALYAKPVEAKQMVGSRRRCGYTVTT